MSQRFPSTERDNAFCTWLATAGLEHWVQAFLAIAIEEPHVLAWADLEDLKVIFSRLDKTQAKSVTSDELVALFKGLTM